MGGLVSQEFSLTNSGDVVNAQLGFVARVAIVDNYTQGFVRLPDAGRDVPPLVFGAVIPLSGTQVARATLVGVSPLVTSSPAVPSAIATVTFFADPVPPSPGHLLQVSAAGQIPRQQIWPVGVTGTPGTPSFTCPINTPVTKTFTLPLNATNVRISVINSNNPSTGVATRLQVIGHSNQIPYSPSIAVGGTGIQVATVNAFRPVDIRIEPSAEPQVDVTCNGDATRPISVFVSAMFGAETTTIAGITSENGVPVTFNTQQVSPAPWQAPTGTANLDNLALAAGAATGFIPAAPAGEDTYLHECSLGVSAAGAFFRIQCATSLRIIGEGLSGQTNYAGAQYHHDYKGGKLGNITGSAGEPVNIQNPTGGGLNFFGEFDFSYA